MLLQLILGSAALMGGAFFTGLAVVIVGIHRTEHGKRLTDQPTGLAEVLARHMLASSRGHDTPEDTREDQ